MSPVPWALRGWSPPPRPAPPTAAYTSPPRPLAQRTDYESTAAGWTAREADVLDCLAEAGGDHAAHQTVHLGDARPTGPYRPTEGDTDG